MKKTIELEYEQVDAIVLDELKSQYVTFYKDVMKFTPKYNTLRDYQKEDLHMSLKYLEVFKQTIKYFTTEEEACAFFLEVERQANEDDNDYVC